LANYREHCKHHLEETDKYCGILILGNIVVSAGRCPFCLSDPISKRLGEYERMVTAFATSDGFLDHLTDHIHALYRQGNGSHSCPHPACGVEKVRKPRVRTLLETCADFVPHLKAYDTDSLLHHFYDDHGINEDLFENRKFSTLPPPPIDKSLLVGNDEEDGDTNVSSQRPTDCFRVRKRGRKGQMVRFKDLIMSIEGTGCFSVKDLDALSVF
jgi:hypothetical protein